MTRILVTGGAGFIGSALCRLLVAEQGIGVVNLDKLTYAGNLDSLRSIADSPLYAFEQADICDAAAVRSILQRHRPAGVIHLAAESHVDRSIDGPGIFIRTNVVGTQVLLEECTRHHQSLPPKEQAAFRFHHVSTDEVYGSLGAQGAFSEQTPYAPRSPYSASKAGADHLVWAWHHTYGLPVVMTNCSNNYGPFQFPEKLIPLMILNAIEGKALPVYGAGLNVRDWLYVDDHVRALSMVFQRGRVGHKYNIGGAAERTNLDVVHALCELFDRLLPHSSHRPHARLVTHVADRPGHDLRYAVDDSKIRAELGWAPREDFASGLERTVRWYLENRWWWERVRAGLYRGERLGQGEKGAS